MVDISRKFVRDHIAESAAIYKRGVRIYDARLFYSKRVEP